jgi:hypothetical protein
MTAGRISINYFILPSNEPALETAAKMAEAAMNSSTNHSDMISFRLATGLAEYRLGHFNGAMNLMQQVVAESGVDFMRDAQALLVLAMAQQQLKHTGEARATLAKGLQIVDTRMSPLECDYLGDDWADWVIAHALMREAKTLVEGSGDATTSSR